MWEHTLLVLFIFVQSDTGAKTIGHKSPTRFKLQPNPTQRCLMINIMRALLACTEERLCGIAFVLVNNACNVKEK